MHGETTGARPGPGSRLWDAAWLLVMAATFWAVASMAFSSAYDVHPDESDHVGAGRYYMQYWDPPKVGDERARGAYSNYGISYLDQLDVVYFFAGKFARLIAPLAGQDYMGLRFFNVGLFLWLMFLCFRLKGARRMAFAPLFLTPQAWYVFSYFNGDALPLALCFMAVYLFARMPLPSGESTGRLALKLGLVIGLLAISKQNYYVFVAYFASAVALAAWARGGAPLLTLRGAAAAVAVAAMVFGLRVGLDAWARHGQDPGVATRVAEQMAAPELKPSVQETSEGFWGARMRSKGVTFTQMFTGEWKWHVFTFRSAFGKYGEMNIEAPLLFYRWLGRAALAFMVLAAAGLALRGPADRAALCLWLVFSLLTVGQSFWHSWNNDFQPQGRYLFPILAMTGCLLAHRADRLGRFTAPTWAVGLVVWGMSMWSFVAVGLARIPR